MNEAADGHAVKAADVAANEVEWELTLRQMTDGEWQAVAELFQSVKGSAGTFTFLDPFGNLLAWSEDFAAAAWSKTDGLVVATGAQDPLGSLRATRLRNDRCEDASIWQKVEAPGSFRYCVSLYARSESPGEVSLYIQAGSVVHRRTFTIQGAWRRLRYSWASAESGDSVQFGLQVGGGALVDIFGFQAEAQGGPSGYKRTGARTGVYTNASFVDDRLHMTSEGPGAYSCTVRVRAAD